MAKLLLYINSLGEQCAACDMLSSLNECAAFGGTVESHRAQSAHRSRMCLSAERAAAELMAKAEAFDRILAVHRDDRLIDEGFSEGVLTVIEDYYGSLAHPEVK